MSYIFTNRLIENKNNNGHPSDPIEASRTPFHLTENRFSTLTQSKKYRTLFFDVITHNLYFIEYN